nr:23S ribosomal RNA methyltransferase Erm [Actinoalloteichus caeruleus]
MSSRSHSPVGGRHELGQNFLVDRAVVRLIAELAASAAPGPVLELAAGDGAITSALVGLGRPVTAVELDPSRARRLAARLGDSARVVRGDLLRHRAPTVEHVVVANVPFHLTTPLLRRLLDDGATWHTAVLVLQWEVARKRAGVGGATMMTAAHWPWFDFDLVDRVPARAFRPVPSVDAGVLRIRRRPGPLLPEDDRGPYQAFVREVFTSRGAGLPAILRRVTNGRVPAARLRDWLRAESLDEGGLPRRLTSRQWAELYRMFRDGPADRAPAPQPGGAAGGASRPGRAVPRHRPGGSDGSGAGWRGRRRRG